MNDAFKRSRRRPKRARQFTAAELEFRERRKASTRARIVAAARRAFLRDGYSISLDQIARRARVARTSVFNLFADKQQLFKVVMEEVFQELLQEIEEVPDSLPLDEALLRYARVYVSMSTNPQAIAVTRISVSQPQETRNIGRMAYEAGRVRSVDRLAVILRRHMNAGAIRPTDPVRLTERFFAAAIGQHRNRIFFNVPGDSPEIIDLSIRETVDLFMRGMKT
jgi:AcrR family transcriptional regulator